MSMYYQARRPSRSEFIALRGWRYHVRLWGDRGAPRTPLVLLHGWMDVAASWQFMVDALPDAFLAQRLVIAPDWRGFGQTTGPACDHYVFADYLGDLECLLDRCCGDAPIDLVGHSMGGNVAMMYAGVRPQRIRRLVNLEGFGMPATRPDQAPARYRHWLDAIRRLHRGEGALRSYDDLGAVAARLMKTNPRLPQDKADWLARQWSEPRTAPDGRTRWHILGDDAHRVISAQLFRVEEQLALYGAITAPTLMVEASDSSIDGWWRGRFTLEEFHQRLRAVRQVEHVTLPECGHMLHHDQPVLLAERVQAFLDA